jgi:hypothetical protein
MFSAESALQTAINLRHDRTLLRPRTWWSALTFYFGKAGAIWRCAVPLLAYLLPGFHPDDERDVPTATQLAHHWLSDNANHWRPVR